MSTGSGECFEELSFEVSPQGYDSTYSSPSQLVPQSVYYLHSLLPEDVQDGNLPFLKIVEQPQAHYKFRYKTEMNPKHGCLHGKSHNKSSDDVYFPGVELFNYNGAAIIKCTLAQVDNEHEHPHKLYVNDLITDISYAVPTRNSYKAWFSDLYIVHTTCKEAVEWLYRGYNTGMLSAEEQAGVLTECKRMVKLIKMNMVRLKFSAHRPDSGEEICAPVFSDPISNIKSAATNILKICRLSHPSSPINGEQEIIMLVEKVIKSNIEIRFFELDEDGKLIWQDLGRFQESSVHHQYAIVFKPPPYRDLTITTRAQVFVELRRPSDGKRSEPREFWYTSNPCMSVTSYSTTGNKRKYDQIFKNHQSVPVATTTGYPAPHKNPDKFVYNDPIESTWMENEPQSSHMIGAESKNPILSETSIIRQLENQKPVNSFKIPETPSAINGTNIKSTSIVSGLENENELVENPAFQEYWDSLLSEFGDVLADSGRGKKSMDTKPKKETYDDQTIIKMMAKELQKIVEMIRIKRESFTKSLQALFDLRLSNGDTFLHLTLDTKQPLLNYLIDLIHASNLTQYLNLKNNAAQTILHQAVANNLCDMIPFLLSKGCDPMLDDSEGNNAIHYGVMAGDSLGALLGATEKYDVPRDLDAYNYEKQTPLHLAVIYKSVSSARLLLASGASCDMRDAAGRTALHLAAFDDCLSVAEVLLEHRASQVNDVDERGYTALQIVCDKRVTDSSIEMVKLLLKYKSDPTQSRAGSPPAWRLAHNKLAIRHLLQEHAPAGREEPEEFDSDEFQSADEGDFTDEEDEAIAEITYPLKSLKLKDDAL